MSEDLITNRQRAVAAFETIRSYATARYELGNLAFRDGITGDPRQDQDRLVRLLAALRHHSDCVSGLRFDDAIRTGRWRYDRERTRLRSSSAIPQGISVIGKIGPRRRNVASAATK